MPDKNANPKKRRWLRLLMVVVVVLCVLIAAGWWYLSSGSFHAWVRARVIADLEQMTGGRVELNSLSWKFPRLEIETRDLTIHGLEPATEIPYAHVDRVLIHARVISWWGRKVRLRSVELDRPVFHLIVNPDGTTNQPTPKVQRKSAQGPVDELFDVGIRRLEIRDGLLVVNDRAMPLDLSAGDLDFAMSYAPRERRYDGNLKLGKIDLAQPGSPPLSGVGDVQFSLWRNRAEIKSMHLKSGASDVRASGAVRDFNQPRIDLTYDAAIDFRQIAQLTNTPEVRGGMLSLNGQASWKADSLSSNGKLAIRNFSYDDGDVHLVNVAAGADFTATRDRLVFPRILASIMGGTVTGDAEIQNWMSSTEPGAKARPLGSARLTLHDLQTSSVAAAISTRDLPLNKINLVGVVNGGVNGRWTGSINDVVADVAAEFTPPPNAAPDQMPVRATLRGLYYRRPEKFEVSALDLSLRATHLTGSGAVGITKIYKQGSLNVAMNTTDVGEWKPVLVAFGEERQIPVELQGRAAFTGNIAGELRKPHITGRLQIENFDSVIVRQSQMPSGKYVRPTGSPPLPPPQPRRMHWDQFTTNLDYSPSHLALQNATLKHGGAQINFDVTVALRNWNYTENNPGTARIRVQNANIPDVLAAVGYNYPVSGTVSFTLDAAGTENDPHGEGHVVITNALVDGEPVARASADVQFANREAQLRNIDLAHNGGRLTGSAGYSLANESFRFDLRGSNFELARLRWLQNPHVTLAGQLNFAARGSGTRDEPRLDGSLQIRNLVANGERVGEITATAATVDDTLRISARSQFQRASLVLDGSIRAHGDFPANLTLQFSHLDIDPALRVFLKGRLTGHSSIAGSATAQGPLRRWREMDVVAVVNEFSADVERVALRNDGPIRLTMSHEVAQLERLRLVGDDTNLNASGSVGLAAPRRLNLLANGNVNLKLLQSFDPDLVSYGAASLNMKIGGQLSRPLINGEIDVQNAGLSYIDWPNGLSDINGRLVFNQDRLQVARLTARTGGGTLEVTGFLTYGQTIGFNLTATGRDVRLRYPPGISSQANADLRLTGTLQNALLSGDVTVTRFGVNPQFDFSSYLARAKQETTVVNPQSLLSRMRLDVRVTSTPELQVQTSLARITGDVDLRLRGTVARPIVLGRTNIIEGDIFFNGTKYHLDRGDVMFTNPVRIEPVLDIELTTTVRDYDITLGLHGPVDKLTTTYRSDPPLATADIVNLLAFGRTREESAQQQQTTNLPETASYAILNQALNAAVGSRVQKLFGVSRIKVDPQAGGAENNTAGARVTIEQQVANNLSITYITDVTRANQQIIQAEYNVNRSVSIIAVRDQNGVVAFDIRIRQRKK